MPEDAARRIQTPPNPAGIEDGELYPDGVPVGWPVLSSPSLSSRTFSR